MFLVGNRDQIAVYVHELFSTERLNGLLLFTALQPPAPHKNGISNQSLTVVSSVCFTSNVVLYIDFNENAIYTARIRFNAHKTYIYRQYARHTCKSNSECRHSHTECFKYLPLLSAQSLTLSIYLSIYETSILNRERERENYYRYKTNKTESPT